MASANEWLLEESIRHALDLRQYENGIVRRLIAVLNRTDSRLFAELTEKLEHLGPDSFSVERLDALLASVRALNTEAFEAVQRELTQTLKEFTDSEVAYQRQMLVTALPVQVSVASVSAESVYAAALARPFQGVLLREVWKDLDAQRMKQVRQTIAQGFVEGRTTAQIIRYLRGTQGEGLRRWACQPLAPGCCVGGSYRPGALRRVCGGSFSGGQWRSGQGGDVGSDPRFTHHARMSGARWKTVHARNAQTDWAFMAVGTRPWPLSLELP